MTRAAARDSVLEQAARSLTLANDTRLPRGVRDEAEEITAELITAANAAG